MRNDERSVGRIEPSSSKRFFNGTAEAKEALVAAFLRLSDESECVEVEDELLEKKFINHFQ